VVERGGGTVDLKWDPAQAAQDCRGAMPHGGRGNPKRAAKQPAQREDGERQHNDVGRPPVGWRDCPPTEFGVMQALAPGASDFCFHSFFEAVLPLCVSCQGATTQAQVLEANRSVVPAVPGARIGTTIRANREEVPAVFVLGSAMATITQQLVASERPVGEINAAPKLLKAVQQLLVANGVVERAQRRRNWRARGCEQDEPPVDT